MLADAGANRIDGDDGAARRLAVGRDRLQHEQFVPRERGVLEVDDDVADDSASCMPSAVYGSFILDLIDDADDCGVDGTVLQAGAIRAELPLTISTVSPKPASTVSTATR